MWKFFKLIRHYSIIQPEVSKTSIELSNITLFISLISILLRITTVFGFGFVLWLLILFLIGGQGRLLYTFGKQRLRFYFLGDTCTFFSIYGTLITILYYLSQVILPELTLLTLFSMVSIGIIIVMIITISLNLVKESIRSYLDMYKKVCIPERKHVADECINCKYYKEVIKK